ncbi:MAG: NAAT family transporter [Verrucomicrobia bacterium]|nr:NAAT family transporter [Verrucomicrobiota bacterium]
MTPLEFILLAASSMFVIMDPIGNAPAFLAMTAQHTVEQRVRMARMACIVAAVLLGLFTLVGELIFKFLGISLPAFQLAGSIILLLVALDMLKAQRSRVQETQEETKAAESMADIAISPLAVPLLAGPGAISTALLLKSKADSWERIATLLIIIAVVSTVTFFILALAARGAKWMGPVALRVTTRIMGLLLAAIAMQFLLNALREVGLAKF